MTISMERFVEETSRMGALSADEARRLRAKGDAHGPGRLAERLVATGKLTPYQASRLLAGRGRELLVGKYLVLDKLGQGGMGTVYRALHPHLQRVVALKMLPEGRTASPEAKLRFEREMEVIGRLDHPHIVRASYAGQSHGALFLAMEYVEGLDLAQVAQRCGPLPAADACEIVRQAAVGLQAIHQQGLVHRDIKPSNLLLSHAGQIKIVDLGLAFLRGDVARDAKLTVTGQAVGTIDYMAPEQAYDSHRVDIRADIYSLGCTLYRLLSGHAPFSGAKYPDKLERLMAHLNDPVPPIADYRGDLPASLVSTLDRMLEKDPAARRQQPIEIAQAMAPHTPGCDLIRLARQPELAAAGTGRDESVVGTDRGAGAELIDTRIGDSAPIPAARETRRRRRLIFSALAATVLLAGLWAASGLLAPFSGFRRSDSAADSLAGQGAAQRRAGTAKKTAQETKPAEKTPSEPRTRAEEQRYQAALTALKRLSEDPASAASAQRAFLEAVGRIGRRRDIIEILELAIAQFPGETEYRRRLAEQYRTEGWEHRGDGNLDTAIEMLSRAIEIYSQDPEAYSCLGVVYSEKGDHERAITELTTAIEVDPEYSHAHRNRGDVYLALSEYDKAIADYSEAVRLNPKYASAYNNRGNAHFEHGEYDQAIADYSEAIECDDGRVDAWCSRAAAKAKLGQFDSALTDMDQALEKNPGSASTNNSLAWALVTCPDLRLWRPEKAVELARLATDAEPKKRNYWNTLGVALYRNGELSAARQALERAVELDSPGDPNDWFFLAMACWRLGEAREARQWYDRAAGWMSEKGSKSFELMRFQEEAAELLGIGEAKSE